MRPEALAFVGRGDRGEHRLPHALNHDRGLRIRLDVCEPCRVLVVPAERGGDEVATGFLHVHERLRPPLAGSAANRAQKQNRMIEKNGPEAAASANDRKAMDGSDSPNQPPWRARGARPIDPLEPSADTHTC